MRQLETYEVDTVQDWPGQWYAGCPIEGCGVIAEAWTESGLMEQVCHHMNIVHMLVLPCDRDVRVGHA